MAGPAIAYYVSGHGFGHAVRSGEVIRELLAALPGAVIHVRTAAPPWLFADLPRARTTVSAVATDVGVVQSDGLRFRARDTLEALEAFEARSPAIAREELAFLREARVRLVVSDASPLPLVWARRLRLPGVALANFGWDAIYRGMAGRLPELGRHADAAAAGYRQATLLLRLPFAMDTSAFPRVVDVPLVVRPPRRDPVQLRRELEPGQRPVVLLSFGGFRAKGLSLARLGRLPRYLFVMASRSDESPPANVRLLPSDGLDHPALVHAADVVVGKPGYGLTAEVVAAGARMVYTSRGRFPEFPILTAALRRTGRALFCPRADLEEGRLAPHLARALRLPAPRPGGVAVDGARRAAAHVAALLGHGPRDEGPSGSK